MKSGKYILCCILMSLSGILCSADEKRIPTPPMGWNSFMSYGVYLYEEAALETMERQAELLLPFGYDHFVIDAGWFSEYEFIPGTHYAKVKHRHSDRLNINEFGLLQPSRSNFPNGFGPLVEKAHALGLKFGIHLMRGIPREAVRRNTKIKGTPYDAAQIADTVHVCKWCKQNYGVDMSVPGAQEFYNSLIAQVADWGVDFIKYDDIVPYPEEVEAVVEAIRNCGRDIVLSLSPGSHVDKRNAGVFSSADMLRVTPDIWDDRRGLDLCFKAWEDWSTVRLDSCWVDMDMIPFGQLQLLSPEPAAGGSDAEEDYLYSGKGHCRNSQLSPEQKYTFITLRAMSASPLMVGGDLLTMDDFSLSLLTDPYMLECNRNGRMGMLLFRNPDGLEVWKTEACDGNGGWIAVFNRNQSQKLEYRVCIDDYDICPCCKYGLYNIWNRCPIDEGELIQLPPDGVLFMKYTAVECIM